MAFDDFDIEIQDQRGNTPEQINGSVTTAGVPVTITPSSGKITSIEVVNPNKGPNANSSADLLYVSFDGTTYATINRGGYKALEGVYLDSIKIDSNNNGVKYEIILTHD